MQVLVAPFKNQKPFKLNAGAEEMKYHVSHNKRISSENVRCEVDYEKKTDAVLISKILITSHCRSITWWLKQHEKKGKKTLINYLNYFSTPASDIHFLIYYN